MLTLAEVAAISGKPGDYTATVKIKPRYVNENCTACGDCGNAVSAEIPNAFNYNLNKTKVAYLPHPMAYPQRFVLDPSIIGTPDAEKAKAACKVDAIDLNMKEEVLNLKVGAVVWATGWKPYDAAKIQPYGYDRYPNVITSVEFERMLDQRGPTGGKLIRPSDGKEAKNVAFIQCAGSRDRNHLKHCSRICCMASLKQSTYVREKFGDDSQVSIYYIDIRAIDRFEDFYKKVQADPKVRFIKSKVANITQDNASGDPILHGVDTEGYHRYDNRHDLGGARHRHGTERGCGVHRRRRGRGCKRFHRYQCHRGGGVRRGLRVERARREPFGAERHGGGRCARSRSSIAWRGRRGKAPSRSL